MKQSGFGIIEIIIAVSIFAMISVTGLVTVIGSFSTNRLGSEHTQATLIAAQGLEAARSIRNQGWMSPFLATPACLSGCGATENGGLWAWSETPDSLGRYTRTVTMSTVQRDTNGDIVLTGGIDDPDTKKITSSVTWNFSPGRDNSVSLYDYFTNYIKAIMGNWATPAFQTAFDLSNENSGNNNADGLSIANQGDYAFLGRASSTGSEIFAIDISSLATPSLCISCQRELGGNVMDMAISGNYIFIASGNNSEELQVLDISSPTTLNTNPFGSFNLTNSNSGNNNADSVALAIQENNLYLTRSAGNEFLRFDITSPFSPVLTGTNSDISGTPTDMLIVGNFAFITSDDNDAELQVFDLNTLSRVAAVNLDEGNNNADGLSLYYAGNSVLLLGRAASKGPELYSINITNPLAPVITSAIETGSDVVDIAYDNDLIFTATSDNASDFVVIRAPDLSSLPPLPAYGVLNTANSPRKLIYVPSVDRVFIVGSDNSAELEIIMPQ